MSYTFVAITPRPLNQAPLSIGADLVSQTLAERVPGRERDWARSLAYSLKHAEAALAQHVAALEEPEGDFAKLDTGSAARQAADICRSQREILEECGKLRVEAELAASAFTVHGNHVRSTSESAVRRKAIPDFGLLRERAEGLLDRLRGSSAAEIRLILDGVNRDIGCGD
jgi:hypothetical protein